MSENCKDLENKAKKITDNPVVAKETYLQVARCWEKKYQKKKAAKAYEKVAQIVCNTADQFEDPEEAQKFYEEAIEYYKKIDRQKEVSKCTVIMAESYITAAKKLHNTRQRIIYAIKYLQTANKIYEQLQNKDKINQNLQLIELIQKEIGLPKEEITSILEEFPELPLIRKPEILETREFEELKKQREEKGKLDDKEREKAKKLEEKEKVKEDMLKKKEYLEKKQEYEKAVVQKLVKEGKSAEEIKQFKKELAELEEEEKSQMAALDQLMKKKEE
ncbi:MAG: hypothetical protein HWN67_16760 [Candidatus Helarchaeota archaeon]|nr:hypothetical protein [Candidatus Helarchaeota archaeon]